MRAFLLAVPLLAAPLAMPARAVEPLTYFSIGTGDIDGGYYAATKAICGVVNRAEHPEKLRCAPETTGGSLYNLAALRSGQLDVAVVQSDWQKHAYEGTSIFADEGPMNDLRSVMSLYPEAFTLIARRDAGIENFRNLIGKRVDIGHPSSGRQATMHAAMEAFGITQDQFGSVAELQSGSAISELCAGSIDATVLIIGHPSTSIGRALENCDAELVPLTGPSIAALIAENTDYSRVYIPLQAYPSLDRDIVSFAVTATMVTRADADRDVVGALVTDTLENLEALGQTTPILADLDPEAMRHLGLTAPLHPAAAAAFDDFIRTEDTALSQ